MYGPRASQFSQCGVVSLLASALLLPPGLCGYRSAPVPTQLLCYVLEIWPHVLRLPRPALYPLTHPPLQSPPPFFEKGPNAAWMGL